MSFQKMNFVGVVTSEEDSMSFFILKKILLNSGFIPIYSNDEENIVFLKRANKQIGLIEITSELAKGLSKLNLNFQCLIHAFLDDEDYNNKLILSCFEKTNGFIILNSDEEKSIDLIEKNNEALIITYGLNKKATITASSLDVNNSLNFNYCLQRELTTISGNIIEPFELPIGLNLIGKWNIYYALAAITGGLCYNIDTTTIYNTLTNIKSVKRNFDKIFDGNFLIIDNSCNKSSDYNITFETIQNLKYRKIVLVWGIEIDEGIYSIKKNLEIIINWIPILGVERLLIYIDEKNSLVEDNISFILKEKGTEFYIYSNLEMCLEEGINLLNKDDFLLLVGGKSLKNGKDIIKMELANFFS